MYKKLGRLEPLQLCGELVRALVRLNESANKGADLGETPDADPSRFRAILRQILGEAWAEVSRGNFAFPRELLRAFVEAEEIVQPYLPDPGEPRAEAAREVFHASYVLHLASNFVRPEKVRSRLDERRRSAFERKVLRVLLEGRDRYLRRADILQDMKKVLPPPYPDPSRVSQILSDLYRERLVMRIHGSAQGNAQTSFFTLSRQGLDLCRNLNLAVRLFEPDASKWQHLLRPLNLAAGSDEKERDERIATFYRPRPGVGCSLALAHCSILLAQEVCDLDRPNVLVVDLEGEESSLQDYLGEQAGDCRGLFGLLDDYKVQPEAERREWLKTALFHSDYVCRPRASLTNLFYLPPFSRRGWVDQFHLYAELMRELRREIEGQGHPDGKPEYASSGFLGDFRHVMRSECAKALVQAPSGLGPGSYLASVLLAEELILFLHPGDYDSENIRTTMQEMVGNCLWRGEAQPENKPSLTFAFSPLALEENFDLADLIHRLLIPAGTASEPATYRTVRLHFDPSLTVSRVPRLGIERNQRPASLLSAGYKQLVEGLHPNSSLMPVYWQSKEQDMEQRRLRVIETQRRFTMGDAVLHAVPHLSTQAPQEVEFRRLGLNESTPKEEPQAVVRHQEDLDESIEALDVLAALTGAEAGYAASR